MEYAGVLTLDGRQVEVVVGVDASHTRLTSNGREVGLWAKDECRFEPGNNGTFYLIAEGERLAFAPNDAAGFSGELASDDVASSESVVSTPDGDERVIEIGPPPGLWVRLGFYVLAAATIALGVWALVSLL